MHNKIKCGYFSFIDFKERQEHHEYNRWHRFDHMPELLTNPGFIDARRFVAPPAYHAFRGGDEPILKPAQYVTYYLLQAPVDRAFERMAEQRQELLDAGRNKPLRGSFFGGPFLLAKAFASPRVLVSPGAIPYRPHTGVFISVLDIVDLSRHDEIVQYYDRVHIPDMLQVKHVAGCYWFVPMIGQESPGNALPNPPGRSIRVYYLDGDPLEMVQDLRDRTREWRAAGRLKEFGPAVKRLFHGPFQSITGDAFDWFDDE